MKALTLLALIALSPLAHADEGVLIKFNRNLDLGENNDAQARYVFTRFNQEGSFQGQVESDGNAMRGCYVNVSTQPNSRGVIEKDRQVRLVKADGGTGNMPQYIMMDPATGANVGNLQCFKHDWEEPNILLKIKAYLDAAPVEGDIRRVPVKYEAAPAQREEIHAIPAVIEEAPAQVSEGLSLTL